MNREKAKEFVETWMKSWNNHDLNAIMSHYDEKLEFHSPFIVLLNFNQTGVITNKTELKKYFEIGLTTYPELNFKLHNYFIGINTLIIYYTSVNGKLAAEFFELNDTGHASKVYCNYSNN